MRCETHRLESHWPPPVSIVIWGVYPFVHVQGLHAFPLVVPSSGNSKMAAQHDRERHTVAREVKNLGEDDCTLGRETEYEEKDW